MYINFFWKTISGFLPILNDYDGYLFNYVELCGTSRGNSIMEDNSYTKIFA